MSSDCRCCRLVAYIGGISELAMQYDWPRHRTLTGAIRPISWIRIMRRVRGILDPEHAHECRGGPRHVRKQVWVNLVRHSVECARTFARHLMEVEPGRREAHVKSQIYTSEMIDAARFLEWKDSRVRDFNGRISDEIACEVMEILVGRDDFPVRMARILGQEPPEPKPYLPAEWIRNVIETEASETPSAR